MASAACMKIKLHREQMDKKSKEKFDSYVFVYCWSNHLFEEEWNIVRKESEMFFDRGGYRLCLFCMLYT